MPDFGKRSFYQNTHACLIGIFPERQNVRIGKESRGFLV